MRLRCEASLECGGKATAFGVVESGSAARGVIALSSCLPVNRDVNVVRVSPTGINMDQQFTPPFHLVW